VPVKARHATVLPVLLTGGVAAAAAAADVLTKAWAIANAGTPRPIIPGVLSTTLTTNTGAVFGLFRGNAEVLAAVSVLIMAAVLAFWWLEGRRSTLLSVAVGLLIGGALGNLWGRVTQGYVVDFLHLDVVPWWPAFNVADVATVAGVALALGWMLGQRPAQEAR